MGAGGYSRTRVSHWAAPVLACAMFLGFGNTEAFAVSPGSAGCQALNGTTTTTIFVVVGNASFSGPFGSGLAAGDRVTITVASFGFGSGTVTVFAPDLATPVGTLAPATGASLTFDLTGGGAINLQASALYLASFNFTCVGTAPTNTGPTNSQILDQTVQTFSKVGAQASATATGDAASGAIGDAFSGGGVTQVGQGSFRTNFAAIENAQDADAKVAGEGDPNESFAALAYKKSRIAYTKAPFRKAPPRLQTPWHVWIDGRFTGFEDKGTTSFDGWHNNVTAGASYRFTQNFLAGVLVGYENFKYSTAVAGTPSSLDGSGVQGGGYFGWKFYDRLRLDGMLTYGRIDYTGVAGPVSGSFGADRITGMAKLSGRYGFGTYYIEPSSMLTIARESQDSFTDTAAVVHDQFNFVVGRSSNGATLGVPLAWGLWMVTPTFGAFADYRFGDQTVAATSVVPTFNNGWSAHVNGGLSVAMSNNVTASAGGEYGGLGDSIQYWRGTAKVGVKF